jgi:hypothetical protein
LFFQDNRRFIAENWPKLSKMVNIALTSDFSRARIPLKPAMCLRQMRLMQAGTL